MAASKRKSTKHNHSAALLAIHALRTNPEYRAAEFIRRSKGAKAMVAKKDTKDYAAALILIRTWNTIGAVVRQTVESSSSTSSGLGQDFMDSYLDAIFEEIPICHMEQGLRQALDKIATDWGEDVAPDLSWLRQEYQKWLERTGKDDDYISRHCKGITAMFG